MNEIDRTAPGQQGPADPQHDDPHKRKLLHRRDFAQIAIGACMMAFPMAATEDVWGLSHSVPTLQIAALALASCVFIAVFVYFLIYHGHIKHRRKEYVARVLFGYLLTLAISALMLLSLDKLPFDEPIVALKRTILVAFPASFAGTVIDSLE